MKYSKKKFDYIIVLIFSYFCLSIISSKHNLSNYDQNKFSNNSFYHVMIKTDSYRHLNHGAEIKRDLENGINYFKTGRDFFSEYMPARLAAAYYYFFDYNLFNNWTEKKINLGIHSYYLFIQCAIYYFALFLLYLVISKQIPRKICFFVTLFLGLEPTIFQYHGTFWSESIFFSLQLLVFALVMKKKTNSPNFFWIGIFLALLSIQRSPAIFYIIPIIIYFFVILKKEIYPRILFILVGYTLITLFTGYHNFVRSGLFYIIPNEVRANVHFYLIQNIINNEEKNNERKLALNWIKENKIEINDKNFSENEYDRMPHSFCEGPRIKNEKDKVKFCNYLRSRTKQLILDKPFSTLKHILYKSLHTPLLNPFHIYSDHHFVSGEVYYNSPTHKKLIPYRIVYTFIIFIISFFGFIKLFRDRNKKLLTLIILSIVYFFIVISWHGNTRYFVPVLIYLSIFFGYGSVSITDFLNKKFPKKS